MMEGGFPWFSMTPILMFFGCFCWTQHWMRIMIQSCGGLPACDHHPPDSAACQRLDRPSATERRGRWVMEIMVKSMIHGGWGMSKSSWVHMNPIEIIEEILMWFVWVGESDNSETGGGKNHIKTHKNTMKLMPWNATTSQTVLQVRGSFWLCPWSRESTTCWGPNWWLICLEVILHITT